MSIDLTDKRVLVAGGSGVIGATLAEMLSHRGSSVVVAGRNAERLTSAARRAGGLQVELDLLDPESITRAVAETRSMLGGLDGLVNAAGIVAFGHLESMQPQDIERIVKVDLIGPLQLLRQALPLERGGFVVNVTGTIVDTPMAGMAPYSAAKAGLASASVALARELRKQGVHLLDARPPHTETGLAHRAIAGEPPALPAGADPAVVAKRIVDALEQGTRVLEAAAF